MMERELTMQKAVKILFEALDEEIERLKKENERGQDLSRVLEDQNAA